jgi:hypothetical protein
MVEMLLGASAPMVVANGGSGLTGEGGTGVGIVAEL